MSDKRCSGYYVTPTGEVVCKDTGEVMLEETFVESGEWSSRKDLERGIIKERTGSPITFTKHNLISADVVLREHRSKRKPPSLASAREQLLRSRRLRIHRYPKEERMKISIMNDAKIAAENLGLPRIVEETMGFIINMYLQKEVPRTRREKKALILAALWKAITYHKLPISKKDIFNEVGGDSKLLWSGLKKLNELGILDRIKSVRREEYSPHRDLLERIKIFIENASSELKLPHMIAVEASKLIDILVNDYGKSLHGRQPEAVAGAVLYLIAHLYNYKISQKKIAEVLGVVESSIRKQYRYLLEDMVFVIEI